MNVLVLAAHPDDEVLGCGGTIARLAGEGHRVDIAILAEGISSRSDRRESTDPAALAALAARAREVAKFLGASSCRTMGLPDNRLDTLPLLDVAKIVEGLINETKPELVFTQHGGDLNIDHTVVFRATMIAARPMAGGTIKALYGYEVGSSTEWAFRQFSPEFRPQVYFDVSATLDRKIQAMQLYETEARAFPHPRSPEALRAQAQRWGASVGLLAAEAFCVVWERR